MNRKTVISSLTLLLVVLGAVFFALVETEKQMRLRLRAGPPG